MKISQVDSSACISVLSFNTTSLLAGNPKSANYKEEADDTAKVAYIKEAVMPGSAALFDCLLYTSPSPRDRQKTRMPSSA